MNIPTNARPSTRILKDLLKVRKELIKVENSNQPFGFWWLGTLEQIKRGK